MLDLESGHADDAQYRQLRQRQDSFDYVGEYNRSAELILVSVAASTIQVL